VTTNSESSSSGPTSVGRGASSPVGEAGPAEGGEPRRLAAQTNELLEYLAYYFSARADRWKVTGRRALFRLESEIIVLLVLAGGGIAGVVFLFIGVAGGLAQLFGNRFWLGNLTAGGLLLGGVGVVVWGRAHWRQRVACERTVEKYEQRKQQQQEKFGRNVAGQAAARRDE
jgi:hypothetical protein